MEDTKGIDCGSVQIHRQVIADIAARAVSDVKGLSLAKDNVFGQLQEFFGLRKYPAISVSVDKANQVAVQVDVLVQYGLNISDLATQAQDLVRDAIDRTGSIELKEININVRGIERGEA